MKAGQWRVWEVEALAKVGSSILDRKYEYTKGSQSQDDAIIQLGHDAAHFGSAAAESIYFVTTFYITSEKEERSAWFKKRYGFGAGAVSNHRHSPTLIGVCNSHYGMHEYGWLCQQEQRDAFYNMFQRFHSEIEQWLQENMTESDPRKHVQQVEEFIKNNPELLRLAQDIQQIAEDTHHMHKDNRAKEKDRKRRS